MRIKRWARKLWCEFAIRAINWLAGDRSVIVADAIIFDGDEGGRFHAVIADQSDGCCVQRCTFLNLSRIYVGPLPREYRNPKLFWHKSPVQMAMAPGDPITFHGPLTGFSVPPKGRVVMEPHPLPPARPADPKDVN